MRRSLLDVLRVPKSKRAFALYAMESKKPSLDGEEDVTEGILLAKDSREVYPIVDGVPVLLEASFTPEFLSRHADNISRDETLSQLGLFQQGNAAWSFSTQWEYHFDAELDVTWGWSVEDRVRQFLLETDIDRSMCADKLILDAGCGNGQLSEALTALGARVVALDYSAAVAAAEKRRKAPNVHFVRGDLQAPPFDAGTFDIVVSNGVLHHTPDTYKTFVEVAKLVKPGGKFYLWLYRKPEAFFRRCCLYPALDFVRTITCRLPRRLQSLVVKSGALTVIVMHKVLGRYKDRSWSWPEMVVSAYDAFTPRWRHYHTPLEVSCWFFMNGYSCPTITHWDNPYGFGMVATKRPQADTPGVNFGRATVAQRCWK